LSRRPLLVLALVLLFGASCATQAAPRSQAGRANADASPNAVSLGPSASSSPPASVAKDVLTRLHAASVELLGPPGLNPLTIIDQDLALIVHVLKHSKVAKAAGLAVCGVLNAGFAYWLKTTLVEEGQEGSLLLALAIQLGQLVCPTVVEALSG